MAIAEDTNPRLDSVWKGGGVGFSTNGKQRKVFKPLTGRNSANDRRAGLGACFQREEPLKAGRL